MESDEDGNVPDHQEVVPKVKSPDLFCFIKQIKGEKEFRTFL